MAHRKSRLIFHAMGFAALLSASLAPAATLSPAARGEIDSLLSRLEASGCQFKRNGSWHTAAEAESHLRRKMDYLVNRGAVASAEQFIERAATQSSMTGQVYLVKCGSQPPVQTGTWLFTELQRQRAAAAPPARSP